MTFKEEANTVYDEKGRALAKIDVFHSGRRLRRTPACSLGEYFAILTWLMDKDEQTASK